VRNLRTRILWNSWLSSIHCMWMLLLAVRREDHTPAVVALAGRTLPTGPATVVVFGRNKSSVELRGSYDSTLLHSAAYYGDLEKWFRFYSSMGWTWMPRITMPSSRYTSLDYVSWEGYCNDPRVTLLLVDHSADTNTQCLAGLHRCIVASERWRIEVVHLLIEHGTAYSRSAKILEH